MTHPGPNLGCLELTLARVDGVLVRVLGAVVRRGYEPVFVRATLGEGADTLEVELRVESTRSISALARYLAKLIDVRRIEVVEADARDTLGRWQDRPWQSRPSAP